MYYDISADDGKLVEAATDVLRRCYRDIRHTVGAAVLCSSGNVYAGVNVEACGYGPCAEAVAFGMAFSNAETEIKSVVAVMQNGEVLSPCGNCRQLIVDYAPDAMVILNVDGRTVKTQARNLLPGHYSSDFVEG